MIKEQDILELGFSKNMTNAVFTLLEYNLDISLEDFKEYAENVQDCKLNKFKVYEYIVSGKLNWDDRRQADTTAFSILITMNYYSGLLIIYHVTTPSWQIMYKKVFTGKIDKLNKNTLRKVLNDTVLPKGKLFKRIKV